MNSRGQAASILVQQSEDRIRREKQLEVLRMAALNLEKSAGFVDGLREILGSLERHCDLILARINFLEGVVDVGREIRGSTQEKTLDAQIEETIQHVTQDVLRNWRFKMAPVTHLEGTRFHSTFDVDRSAQLYVLCHPIKFHERRMGTLTAVKVCYGNFEPKTEQAFLSILTSLISQSAMINRFYPDHLPESENQPPAVPSEKPPFDRSQIIGNSKATLSVFELMQQVADTDTSVLILGESGVGKELIADALHRNSSRRLKPFIKVNCAALPETLLESELFGHERGAFTGAHSQKKGRFELASGGTLFLDEIGDLSLTTQIKLLRVLQQREFERLGGVSTIKTDVRVIAATNRKLESMIEQGLFRQDLYYRLNVFPIHVPPLRERKTDIMPITDFFIEKYRKIHNKNIRRISTPAIDMLTSYHWPGNVRELENCMERAVLLSNEGVIRGHHLPPSLQIAEASGNETQNNMKGVLESMERELILDALKASKGNMAKAARELGLTERVMGLRAKKYGLDPRKFRKPNS